MSNENVTVSFVTSTDELVANHNIQSATSIIDFRSNGHCLIIGDADAALSLVAQLTTLKCTVASVDPTLSTMDKQLTDNGITVFRVPGLILDGYLGAFTALVDNGTAEPTSLAVSAYLESGAFDLVLDLSEVPLMPAALPPLGYFRGHNEVSLQLAMDALPDLLGDFEKPKYFDYDASICAHSRSQLNGCNACISVCATGAIQSDGESVAVDPYLCQGCGSCATVCPSGAMTYAYPKPDDAIERTRAMLKEGGQCVLLLHNEDQQTYVDSIESNDDVLTLLVEEVSAFGMDYWASMLSAGVHRILLLVNDDMHEQSLNALHSQINVLHELLAGMDVKIEDKGATVQVVGPGDLHKINTEEMKNPALTTLKQSSFATHNNKRQTLRNAIDVLAEQLKPAEPTIELDNSAPFGVIEVDKDKCTLCMACVSSCPGKALLDGQDSPALRMIEANCLQCGLCDSACPESAISLKPRYNYDSIEARKIHTLNEEEPFNCIRCQKPFATAKIIQTMFAKLDGHWMFKDDAAKRRLKMCEDCRVKDMFEHDAKGIDVHKNENA